MATKLIVIHIVPPGSVAAGPAASTPPSFADYWRTAVGFKSPRTICHRLAQFSARKRT